jgi:transcriptional regulator of arginine metabolism
VNKSFRHGQILKLITAHRVHTQQELASRLQSLGVEATQVTLSRDTRELGLVKTSDGYRQMQNGAPTAGPTLAAITAEFLLDARAAQNLLVLKTAPGSASPLARALDEAAWPEIIGTIAGDDTVLAIAPDAASATRARRKLLTAAQE